MKRSKEHLNDAPGFRDPTPEGFGYGVGSVVRPILYFLVAFAFGFLAGGAMK